MIPVHLLIKPSIYICFVMVYSTGENCFLLYCWFYIHFHSADYDRMFYMYGHVPDNYHDYEISHMHNIFYKSFFFINSGYSLFNTVNSYTIINRLMINVSRLNKSSLSQFLVEIQTFEILKARTGEGEIWS